MCIMCMFGMQNVVQTDVTTHGPHMSCPYSDIAMAHLDNRAENYTFKHTVWKHFRDDAFSVWTLNINTLPAFLD